jgi:hypothetical protein
MEHQQTVPGFETPQQRRAAVELEMQMYGLDDEQRQVVMQAVDSYVVEAIVASTSEMLTTKRDDVRWTLWDIEHRVMPGAPVSGEEMLARVTAAAATRSNVVDSYDRIRKKLAEKPVATVAPVKPAPKPVQAAAPAPSAVTPAPAQMSVVQTPAPQSQIVSVAVAGWNLVKPTLTLPARLLLYLFGIFITFVIVIWFLNASGMAGLMQGKPPVSILVQPGTTERMALQRQQHNEAR